MTDRNPLDRLPHEGSARLPDEVVSIEPGSRVVARKHLGSEDPHLNETGRMPWVLVVELMAQVGGLLMEGEGHPGEYAVLAGIRNMRLHDTARAGETLSVECILSRRMGDLYMIDCRSWADDRDIGHGTFQLRRVRGGGE